MAEQMSPGRLLRHPVLVLAAVVMLASAGCCLADCGSWGPTPFQTALQQEIRLTPDTPVIARHVTWTVGAGRSLHTAMELRAAAVDPGDDPENACATGVNLQKVRIVPDDRSIANPIFRPDHCEPIGLNLLAACESGCQGGATILLYYDPPEPRETSARLVVSLRGDPAIGSDATLQLVVSPTPGEESAARIETDFVEGPMDVFASTPTVTRTAVLHVSAEALRAPLSGINGSMRIGIRQVDGDGQLGTSHLITVGTLDAFRPDGTSNTEVDWLSQCQPEVDCDIEIEFNVSSPGAGPDGSFGPGENPSPDFYRWVIKAGLDSLDGRELPADALRVEAP